MQSHLHLARSPGDLASAADAPPIRVLLADDHAAMLRGLRQLLEDEDDVEVIAEARDLASVDSQVHSRQPHVLVLDLGMADGSSVEAIGRLRERAPDTRIVALTMEESPVLAQRALAAGATGYVSKDLADSELPRAIRAAVCGEQFVSPPVASRLETLRRSLALRHGLLGTR
jgi:DNA-binding NarL/FixJ family response regulator